MAAAKQLLRIVSRAGIRCTTALPVRSAFHNSHRGYSSQSTRSRLKTSYWGIGAAPVTTGLGYWLYSRDNTSKPSSSRVFSPQKKDYQAVYDHIAALLEEHDKYGDGSYSPIVLRLAWYSSGTYDAETNTSGSNGATMRFAPEGDHGANSGLKTARDFLKPVKGKFPWISYSDLWTLAGVAAVQEMQGPIIPWRPGRADRDVSFCTLDGRLPDGSKGAKHLRAIFGRMGFNDQEIVALSGAHALGRCHTDRSGFEGSWTFSPTVFSNDFYTLLFDERWHIRKWDGPKQFQGGTSKSLMMLPTDMEIINDKEFRNTAELYAKDVDKFYKDFAEVFAKLLELGVPFKQEEKWTFDPSS